MSAEAPLPQQSRRRDRAVHVVLAVLLLATVIVRFWRSPYEAGGRLSVPDGAEYAVAAERLATFGRLDIDVGGERFPSRYPPLFSAVLLAPVYAVAPGEIGNGIVVVTAFALLMAAGAYGVGWQLAGAWGAVGAVAAVAFHPLLAEYARIIMSDVPAAALAVTGMALFLRMWHGAPWWTWLLAGLCAALAAGLRPLAGTLLLPFLLLLALDRRRPALRSVLLLAPTALLAVVTALYNARHFGAWWRTGYHYWCPIPYDFPSLTWSWRYLFDNARVLAVPSIATAMAAGAVGVAVLYLRRHPTRHAVAMFLALAALPISAAHLYYFHREPRFHAMLVALCCVTAGAGAAALLPAAVRDRRWAAVVVAALVLAVTRPPPDRYGSFRPRLDLLAMYVPAGGTIVTRVDPIPLEPTMLRPGGRHWLPLDRRQNYAGHAVARRRLVLPVGASVTWPGIHRQPPVFAAGAREAVPWTALERPDLIARRALRYPGVYLDAQSAAPGSEPFKQLERLFEMQPMDPAGHVVRLWPRDAASVPPAQ